MTRRRATTISGGPEPTALTLLDRNNIPLTRFLSLGVEEAVDKERALQDVEAERDRRGVDGKGVTGDESEHEQEDDVYDRFSERQKKVILDIVAFAAFLGRK